MSTGAGFVERSVVCPVLIGRAAAVEGLRRLVDATAEGAGRVALVSGEAGIGKSRLVGEARGYAGERGFLVLEGACFPRDRTSPYAPILDLLRGRLLAESAGAAAEVVGSFALELYPLLPDLVRKPAGAGGGTAEPEQERRRLFAALAYCLAGPNTDRPLLLAVEDLHWCDDASLDFLLYLARRTAGQPLLLLGTYRDEEADPRLRQWLAQLGRARPTQALALGPLAREDIAAMLGAIFGQERPTPPGLEEAVWELSEGNPLHAEELLEALVSSGEIRPAEGGGWDWDPRPVAEWQLPRSLQEAVQQRAERLSPSAREVVTLAAVIGRRFDFELLQVLAQVDERTLISLLKESIAAQLVVEESRDRFAFRHALTRQAIYAGLLARERTALHRTVAACAEQLYAGSLDRHLDDLAAHAFEAEAWDKALDWAQQAGERALRLYAPRAAIEGLGRALDAAHRLIRQAGASSAPVPTPTLAALHRARGRAYETIGEFEAALADYGAAVELARMAGDERAEWQGLLDLGVLWSGRDYDRAGPYLERALELARALGDPAVLAHSLNRVGNWRVNTEQPREALALHREALAIFERLGERRGIAETLDLLGMAGYLSADLSGSIAFYERAAELYAELDDRQGLVGSLAMLSTRAGTYELGTMAAAAAGLAAGRQAGERAIELARAIDWRSGEAFALAQLASVLGLHGHYARGLELAGRSLAIAEEIGHLQWLTLAHTALGELHLDMLDLPAARRHLERARDLARELRSAFWTQLSTGCLAWAYALDREPGRAAAVLGPTPDAEAPVRSLGERWMTFGHTYLALARREPELAMRLIDRLNAPPLDGSERRDTPRPAFARAEALMLLGRHAEAEQSLRSVRDASHRQVMRSQHWRAHAGLGQACAAQGRPEEAQREFSTARSVLEELSAELPEGLREAFLRNTTARLPRPYRLSARRTASARAGGLTEREREVAGLVARGRSNREIAEALVLGERTIETHVSNILSKLGLTSRREIATWAQERGLADPTP
jgi:DNA-binding CsgD family transcriptional regulator